jgi:hypothetical protein
VNATAPLRPFVYEGHRLRLNEDPAVRAADVARCRISVIREDGSPLVVDPAQHALPPLPGIPPPGEIYNPRLVLEEVLRLEFDDHWLWAVFDHLNRYRLLDPGRPG